MSYIVDTERIYVFDDDLLLDPRFSFN